MSNEENDHTQEADKNAQNSPADLRRRKLMKGMAMAAGAAVAANYLPTARAAGSVAGSATSTTTPPLPADNFSDIQHIIVLMMENRSFDHMLGWVPGANGVQAGRNFTNEFGVTLASNELTNTQNILGGDPQHTYSAARVCYNSGTMDGFLLTEGGLQLDTFPLGYFERDKVPFFAGCADYFTIGDCYYTGVMGPTWPNRIYMHSGQTDRLATGAPPANHLGLICNLPTIWDQAKTAGVSHKYYYSDIPYTALWGTRLLDISHPISDFFSDAAAGTLPSLSFVDPASVGELIGLSNDDHPIADIRNGQAFMDTIYNAVRLGPKWANTLLVINYDEFGGFADHVAPPIAPVSEQEANLIGGGNDGRLGIRVPFALIGPRARRNSQQSGNTAVVKNQYDPNAILNFICDHFGMPRMDVVRSQTSGSLATALLSQQDADYSVPPAFPVPSGNPMVPGTQTASGTQTMTVAEATAAGMGDHLNDLRQLQQLAIDQGFSVFGLRL